MMDYVDIAKRVDEYVAAKAEEDEAKLRLDRARAALTDLGIGEYVSAHAKAVVNLVAGRKTTRVKDIVRDGFLAQEVVDKYTSQGEDSFRVTIKPI